MNEENNVETTETKKKPGRKPKISNSSKPPIISVDTSISDMLQYDSDGCLLAFDTSPEGFKKLSDEVIKELSFDNKMRYRYAQDFHKKEAGEDKEEWKDRIVVTEEYSSPIERTQVKNADPDSSYYLATPNKIGKHQKRGFRLLGDSEPESIGLSGKKTIGTLGNEELVLMKTTKENSEKLKQEKKTKNEWRKGNIEGSIHDLGDRLNIDVKDIN